MSPKKSPAGETPGDAPPQAKKKAIDVFWMDDEDEVEQFKQKEQKELVRSHWQGIKGPEEVLDQILPMSFGAPGMGGSLDGGLESFERELRRRSRSGSFADRVSATALQRLMGAQMKGGSRGRVSRFIAGLAGRLFGAMGRVEESRAARAGKKRKVKKPKERKEKTPPS